MGPVIAPGTMLEQLGPVWDKAKGPILTLLAILLAIIAVLWWISTR